MLGRGRIGPQTDQSNRTVLFLKDDYDNGRSWEGNPPPALLNKFGGPMITAEATNIQACIEACEEAIHACQTCAAADIREGSSHCALINLDCADICSATMNALARASEHHGDFCSLCAHICRACASACAEHAATHAHCAQCQAACEKCAIECAKHAKERHTM